MIKRSFYKKNVMITGISGFGGSWLAETLLKNEKSAEIFGLKRQTSSLKNVAHILDSLKFIEADIADIDELSEAVRTINPQIVFHLAAISSSMKAAENPKETKATNVDGTKNLLKSLTESAPNLEIFHFASSSTVYKDTSDSNPMNEKHPVEAHDAYSKSKIDAEKICWKYSRSAGIPIIITRAFNQAGPRCREEIVANKIAKIAAEAKMDGTVRFAFGNVNVVRDFTDVRDIVRGYWLAAKKGKTGEVYNLCSGRGISISEMINMSLSYVKLKGKVEIDIDRKLLRSREPEIVIGDNAKARKNLGWKPKIPFEQTLKEMIDNYLSES